MKPRARPQSLTDLFVSFSWMALQGFGGVLAVAQHELVERKGWLTREEFVEEWAVVQIMPGPNVVNLSLAIGGRHFGWRGALAALAGMLALPLVIVLLLAVAYGHYYANPALAGALRGMGAVAAALMLATGLKLSTSLKGNPLGLPLGIALAAAAFGCVALMRWPLAYTVLGLGSAAYLLAYWRAAP
jgi:chromate transporter